MVQCKVNFNALCTAPGHPALAAMLVMPCRKRSPWVPLPRRLKVKRSPHCWRSERLSALLAELQNPKLEQGGQKKCMSRLYMFTFKSLLMSIPLPYYLISPPALSLSLPPSLSLLAVDIEVLYFTCTQRWTGRLWQGGDRELTRDRVHGRQENRCFCHGRSLR